MSTSLARNILRIPGRLVKNPTDMTAVFPYGGTELGVFRDMWWSIGIKSERLVPEDIKAGVAHIVTEFEPVASCCLRSWDNDFIASVFMNAQTDSFGEVGDAGKVQGTRRAGFDLADLNFKLLFAPLAEDFHRFLYFPNAIPLIDETQQIRLSLAEEFGIVVLFSAAPDSQGRTHIWDIKENIVL